MLQRLKKLKLHKNELVKSSSKLFTGALISQVILFGSSPILARLYTPTDYGYAAIFLSVTAILVSLSTIKYDLSIIIPETNDEAARLALISTVSVLIVSLATLIAVYIDQVAEFSDIGRYYGWWMLLMPLAVLLGGLVTTATAVNVRSKSFGVIAYTNTSRTLISTSIQLVAGVLNATRIGLILGGVASIGASVVRLFVPVYRMWKSSELSPIEIKKTLISYKRFPLASGPASILSSLNNQGINLAIGALFSLPVLGVWFISQRIINLPLILIGESISRPYTQQASQLRSEPARALKLFDRVLKSTLVAGTLLVVTICILSFPLFKFFFPPDWSAAPLYILATSPWIIARVAIVPTAKVQEIYGKNHAAIYNQLSLMAILLALFFLAKTQSFSILQFLLILSCSNFAAYLIMIYRYRRIIKLN